MNKNNPSAQYYDHRESESFIYNGKEYDSTSPPPLAMDRMSDRMWRLDNLYSIVDEDGLSVPFKLRPIQRHFLENMWYRNVILKSRQHGFTTVISIWELDNALFTKNYSGLIIAHKKDDAAKILKTKVEFPYSNLHPEILSRVGVVASNKSTIEFSNGSMIEVSLSGRSGTRQTLHVSELGYTAKHRPDIAEEIKLGSYPAVHQNGFIIVESTADGPGGDFHDMCMLALNNKREGKKLTRFDFKFFFYAWFDKPDNVANEEDIELTVIRPEIEKYLDELQKELGITLSLAQKVWYAKTEEIMQEKMKQEHPSTPEESFENSGEGYYYSRQMADIREQGRLIKGIPASNTPIGTYWDIGVNDPACCWFIQRVGEWYHVLGYYEDTDNGMDVHIPAVKKIAEEQGWYLSDEWVGPHDMKQRAKGNAVTLQKECAGYGAKFRVVPKIPVKLLSIQASRRLLDKCKFDIDGPNMKKLGVKRLDEYRKQWSKQLLTWGDTPRKDMAGHGSDAFQCFAMDVERGYDEGRKPQARPEPNRSALPSAPSFPGRSTRNKMRAYT